MGLARFRKFGATDRNSSIFGADEAARQAAEILLSLWGSGGSGSPSPASPSPSTQSIDSDSSSRDNHHHDHDHDHDHIAAAQQATTLILAGYKNGKPLYKEDTEEVKNEIVYSFSRRVK